MQESVGHGAPSPKLVKLEEIILQHFRKNLLGILIFVVLSPFSPATIFMVSPTVQDLSIKNFQFPIPVEECC